MTTPAPGLNESHRATLAPASVLTRILQCGTLALLLFAPLAFGATEPWAILVLQAGSTFLLALWLFTCWRQPAGSVRWSPAFGPILLFAVLVFLQLVANRSAYWHASMAAALLYCAYAILCFLATQLILRPSDLTWLGWILSAYGFLVSLFAVAQSLTSNGKIYWLRTLQYGGWIFGPYVNHNHYAGLMEMLIPIPLAICLSRRVDRGPKVLLGFAATFMTSTVFLSGSRGGMTAIAVELALFALFLGYSRHAARSALILGVCLAAAAVWVAWLSSGKVSERIATVHSEAATELSSGLRLSVTRDCLRMFRERPVFGWGLDTFSTVYPGFQSFYSNLFVNRAHNDYAQLLAEMGVAGFLAVFWFVFAIAHGAWRKLRGNNLGVNACAALAGALACAGILVHSFVDFNLHIPANAALFYVIGTITAGIPLPEHRRGHRSTRL